MVTAISLYYLATRVLMVSLSLYARIIFDKEVLSNFIYPIMVLMLLPVVGDLILVFLVYCWRS